MYIRLPACIKCASVGIYLEPWGEHEPVYICIYMYVYIYLNVCILTYLCMYIHIFLYTCIPRGECLVEGSTL
jgi:hypothetical protein